MNNTNKNNRHNLRDSKGRFVNWVLGLDLRIGERSFDRMGRVCVVARVGRGDNGTPVLVAKCGDVVWPYETVKKAPTR